MGKGNMFAPPKLKTRTNRLTRYGFACGYIERKKYGSIETELYQDGCFHVRQFNWDKSPARIFWHSFEKLGEARDFFNRQKGKLVK